MKNLDRSLIDSGPYDIRPLSRSELTHANNLKREYMRRVGFQGKATPSLLGKENTKLKKSKGAVTYGLSLLPADLSGVNVCSFSTAGCRAGCLASAGRGRFDSVSNGRRWRTNLLAEHPDIFIRLIAHELRQLETRHGKKLAVRLNVLSDLRWELFAPNLFREFETVQFYDYTKFPASGRKNLPDNYYLTGSYSERNTSVKKLLKSYPTVAVVFESVPVKFQGVRVIDGDAHDDRYSDPNGVIVGLKAKGDAIGDDSSGFVVTV